MKPVVDEMFPEGAGQFIDMEEVSDLDRTYNVWVLFVFIFCLTSKNGFHLVLHN